MQIGNQTASQINNIESLNGDFNISGNTFNLEVEIKKNEKDLLELLLQIQNELKIKGIYSQDIEINEKTLKNNIEQKSTNGILNSYKEYIIKLKEITNTTVGLSENFGKLFKLGASIGTFITLLL